MEAKDDFDVFADDYRQLHDENIKLSGTNSDYFSRMKVELLREFENNNKLKVLDLGCGDGNSVKYMNHIFPDWYISGIDISSRSIELAQKKGLKNAEFKRYDGLNIPFDDGVFDLVFIAGVLHHVPFGQHEQLLTEIKRVLKNDGRVYIFEHNPLNPLTRYFVKTCIFDEHAKLLNARYLKELIIKTGFQIDFNQFIIFFPRYRFLKWLLPVEKYLKKIPLGGQYYFRAIK